jgi:hypothetical protein
MGWSSTFGVGRGANETEYKTSEVKLRKMRCAEHVARTGQRKRTYMISVGRPEKKTSLIPRRRWEDNIKADLQVTRWGCELD